MSDETTNDVAEVYACPRCDERSSDMLIWIDDDNVRCFNCGTVYQPVASDPQEV